MERLAALLDGFGWLSLQSGKEPESKIECGCCSLEFPFRRMVQCSEGHLFCTECLQRHAENSTFATGQTMSLTCLDTDGCTSHFPWSEVVRTLPPDVLKKYEKRMAEESVARASITGLVYCPVCSYPFEVDPSMKNLDCPHCKKSTCLKCRKPNHGSNPCNEGSEETTIRRHIEERMTMALVRKCPSCGTELLKNGGCNKMTCTCGTSMCYVCREKVTRYDHFCQHGLEQERCFLCFKCGLYSKEVSDKEIQATKEKAVREAAIKEPSILRQKIGPEKQKRWW